MRVLLAIILGAGLGLMITNKTSHATTKDKGDSKITASLFLGLSGTCLIGLGSYTHAIYTSHQWINYDVLFNLYKAKPPYVIAAATFTPLCFILLIRAINRQSSSWYIPVALLGVATVLFTTFFSNTKNGVAIFILVQGVFLINLLFKIRWNWARITSSGIILAIILSASYWGINKHIEKNNAWPNLIADIKVAVDIDHHNYWKNRDDYPLPQNQYGSRVNPSTYERAAWFTVGIHLLTENPLGFGLIHHSFGWLALAEWPDYYKPNGNMRGATHSGWMDMALGIGIPGILLIWIPLFAAWYRSLFQKGLWFTYTAWTIPIIMFAYLSTEVGSAHFTEMLYFMAAFFCGITLQYPAPFPKIIQWIHKNKK